ncbi:DUF92 domain-containing protein [Candidatus Micrarchaeota archaeon]|nr:DUF92 domain-containing protein [Candidatus Micrarchaeota archaeon]MBU1930347.1 DUF92 domain-containing protein [Candidatus Micrarchaeota archaeon]
MTTIIEASIVLFALGIFSFFSYKRNWLNNEGILIANIIGLSTFILGGGNALTTLFVFFGVGEAATYFIKGKKKQHHQRNTGNILGNSLASIVALLLSSTIGFFGAISASLADTLSSEIGVLSKKKPRMITTLKTVQTGVDGGVSALGFLAAIIGALIVSGMGFLFGLSWEHAVLIFLAGLFGGIIDSVFGATIQQKKWVDNNEVNFLGSSAGALFAVLLGIIFGLL